MSLEQYRSGKDPIPKTMPAWYLYGAGLENLGKAGKPTREDVPAVGADELLTRVDAVGICASDAKMIKLGDAYPLFRGRDLATNPARLGHELALTVVKVGDNLRRRYQVGQRLALQPDVYFQSRRRAIGSTMPGGMTAYMAINRALLQGDDGACLLPVADGLAYADVALSEPWACVLAAYRPFRRLDPLPGGLLWISGHSGGFDIDFDLEARLVIASDVSAKTRAQLRQRAREVIWADGISAPQIAQEYGTGNGIDDIILLEPSARQICLAQRALARRGTLTIASRNPAGRLPIDISRIHYDFIGIIGANASSLASAYGEARNRSELAPGGLLLIHGGGGPLGQMHLERALNLAAAPRTILVTNRGVERLRALRARFAQLAAERGIRLITISPTEQPGRLENLIADRGGCDDIMMMFPSLEETRRLPALLKAGGVINLFAGLPPGNEISLASDKLIRDRCQVIGTSGSSLEDQARVLANTANGQFAPASSVSAVGGLQAVKEAIIAINERRYSGKIVLYPALHPLPLTSLPDLGRRFPALRQRLGRGEVWTKAAEEALFREYLG